MKNLFFKKKNKEEGEGFTLVESLISITILMISVAAPLSLAGKGLIAADIAQRQIVAFYLAQDAIESLINVKMGNKLDLEGLLKGMGDCKVNDFSDNNACTVDTSNLTIISCSGDSDCSLKGKMYKNANGFYHHTSSNGYFSGFTRFSKIKTISISNPGSIDQEAEIETTVQWIGSNGEPQEYKLNTHIANW